jgi:hypothetical protein
MKEQIFELPFVIDNFDFYYNSILNINNRNGPIIDRLYGSFNDGYFGTGRPNFSINLLNYKDFSNYIDKIKEGGLSFSYCLNAPSFCGQEGTKIFHNNLNHILSQITELGIDEIIVSNPYVIYLIDTSDYDINITVSSFLPINNKSNIEYLNKFKKVKKIIFPPSLNFRIEDIISLTNFAMSKNIKMVIMLNISCSLDCLLYNYHSSITGYSTEKNDTFKLLKFIEYSCIFQRENNSFSNSVISKEQFIKILNCDNLLFKLQGRQMLSENIIKALEYYIG